MKVDRTIEEIAQYISEEYPDSDFALDYQNKEMTHDELVNECCAFFYYEKLGWCDCGTSDLAVCTVMNLMEWMAAREVHGSNQIECRLIEQEFAEIFGVTSILNDGLMLCLAYTLDAAELVEHEDIISEATLTDEGWMFLTCLEENVVEEDVDAGS